MVTYILQHTQIKLTQTTVRRDASNAEILCGKVKQQIQGTNKRAHTHTLASEVIEFETLKEKRGYGSATAKVIDDSATYKRHHIAQNKVDTTTSRRHHVVQNKADASTNEKRHHASETETTEISRRIPPPSSNVCRTPPLPESLKESKYSSKWTEERLTCCIAERMLLQA